MKTLKISISTSTFIKALVFTAIGAIIFKLIPLLVIITAGVIISSFTNTLADPLIKNLRLPRQLAVITIFTVMLATFGLVFYLIVPQIASEIGNITSAFPPDSKVNTVVNALSDFASARKALSSQELVNTEIFTQTVQSLIKTFSSGVISGVSGFFQGIVNIILVLVISIYISTQEKGVEKFLRTVTPRKYESSVIRLWNRTNHKIGQWLKSQLLSSAILTILTYIGLTIINMPYTVVLSLIAGITSLVPFGIFIGTLPAIIIALTTGGFGMVINVIILYTILQQIQDYGFQPYIVGKATGVPSVGVLISFIASVTLFGVWGVFIGLPAAILVSELFQELDHQQTTS